MKCSGLELTERHKLLTGRRSMADENFGIAGCRWRDLGSPCSGGEETAGQIRSGLDLVQESILVPETRTIDPQKSPSLGDWG